MSGWYADSKRGSYVPVDEEGVGSDDSSSMCIEKRDTFFFGGSAAGTGGVPFAGVWAGAGDVVLGVVELGLFFFFLLLNPTDNGLNMRGFPTSFTSSAGFCPSGIDGAASCFFGGGRVMPPDDIEDSPLSASAMS